MPYPVRLPSMSPRAQYGGLGRNIPQRVIRDFAKAKRANTTYPQAPKAAPSPQAGPAPPPVDATYDEQIAGLNKRRDSSLTGLRAQRDQGLLDYGYNAKFNDQGGVANLSFDPSNPYSRAAMMKQRFDQSRAGTGNSMAARGQLYAGAYQNAQDHLYRQQGQSEDALQKSLIQFLSRNVSEQNQAGTDYETAVGQAKGDRLSRSVDNPLYAPVVPEDPGAAPAKPKPKKPSYTDRPWMSSKGAIGVLRAHTSGRKVFVPRKS